MKYILEPLDEDETKELIDYRIRQAGYRGRTRLFNEDAIKEIHRVSGGYPRKTAMLCHKALKSLVMKNQTHVSHETVEEIVTQEIRAGWHNNQANPLQKSNF